MKIRILLIIFCVSLIQVKGQFRVTPTNDFNYTIKKDGVLSSYTIGGKTLIYIKYKENMLNKYDAFLIDENSTIKVLNTLKINAGTFKNMREVIAIQQLKDKLYAIIENRNKDENKNSITASEIDIATGNLNGSEVELTSMNYTSMGNPGVWHICNTSNKLNMAVVAEYPSEKKMPQVFKYYFFDETLKSSINDEFTIGTGEKRKDFALQFFAGNNGNMFLVNVEFDKSYRFPVVYSKKAGEKTVTENLVVLQEPNKNFDYKVGISNDDNLAIAGYYQEKKTLIVGDVKIIGTWYYNSQNPSTTKTFAFDKPITNMTAHGINFNNNQVILTGQQIKKEKEPKPSGQQGFFAPDVYRYEMGNLVITTFDDAGENKSDMVLTNDGKGRDEVYNLLPSFGMYNGKYSIIFNDDYGKYNELAQRYSVPVTVNVTNQNLMEKTMVYGNVFDLEPAEKYFRMVSVYPSLGVVTKNGIVVFGNESMNTKNYFKAYIFK